MLINEVCKTCELTKKAIEYYMEQGLISPKPLENGYRSFEAEDIEKLKKICVLRKLGVGIADIRAFLNDGAVLDGLVAKKALEVGEAAQKQRLLEELAKSGSWESVSIQAQAIEAGSSIAQKLLDAFPGYYGQFLSMHFTQFLNEPIRTPGQQDAYQTIVAFLDSAPGFPIPPELRENFEEAVKDVGTEGMRRVTGAMKTAVEDIGLYLDEHRESIEAYIRYKNTEEYKNSEAYRMQVWMRQLNRTNGYYDVFLPAMKRLSPSYERYCVLLKQANEIMLEKYPELAEPEE